MPAIDPAQLLKALAPLLLPTGGIRGTTEASRIVSLMKDANKLVSKCLYLNILTATEGEEVLQKVISMGGWDTLNKWLQSAKEEENVALMAELLKVYQTLPVTVDHLKKDNTARVIKGLTKHESDVIKSISSAVVDSWMKKIKGSSENDSDKLKKKKKKDKERDKEKSRDKDRRKDEKHLKSGDKKDGSFSSDRKDSSHNSRKDSSMPVNRHNSLSSEGSQKDGDATVEDNPENSRDSLGSGSGVDKNNFRGKECDEDDRTKRKPKTVRVFTNKFRSVFEDDDPLPPIKKKTPDELKASIPIVKRNSNDLLKDEPAEKVPRLTLKMPPLVPDGSLHPSVVSPTNTSPPEVTHGRIKIIPPKRPPAHEIHESNVFMNELTKATYQHGSIKRKKKSNVAASSVATIKQSTSVIGKSTGSTPPSTPTTPTTSTPITPPTPVSPVTAMAQTLPSVPPFYRDTLDSIDDTPSQGEIKASSLPPEKMEGGDSTEPAGQEEHIFNGTTTNADVEMKEDGQAEGGVAESAAGNMADKPGNQEEDVEMTDKESADAEPKGLLATGSTQSKKRKKRVSWVEDINLRQIFYFELDETERENVNRPKTFSELKKQEMMQEGRAMESAKRLISDNMVEVLPWRRPPVIDNTHITVERGCNSVERGIQQVREQGVLQALFFTKEMLPDSPSEPDMDMNVTMTETKIIPLEDETSSGEEYEHTYSVDPGSMPYDPAFDISAQTMAGGASAVNNSQGIQLPPDLNNMLASIQQQSIATGGQSLQANSAVMANVQGILTSIMHGGQGSNSDELINKLRLALEPLKNQIGGGPMPGMNPQDPNNPPFRPPGPARHGLLGNAPPGYNPMMVGGRPPFPPQGPGMGGMGGMEGGENWNMAMGMHGGPPGPGFHPMPVPMPNPGMGGNGPVMSGPRPMIRPQRRGQRAVCRHFVAPTGCRYGNACAFLHPGVNGPPLNN
ncbi:hypothetical protein C0Q70_18350 [Pomacea canaliculata]|uniref:Serine/threonine-protein phosphatase 1 regulatory subunit 10 n=1 Tax=Pomacea canaliculata TaxID=400727 RepID=A0A2T7NN04_POMCA|nr:serine/threonine-protein phosphatase 1 regulatory subunit 10-like isoform X2 [Pomacea canaliculata]PVD22536.1 hypothetical protein C0Q70_18350 [Pomacea canaliculata]